jgi:hypothetical protein
MKKSFTIVFVFLLLYLFVGMTNNLYAATLSISPSSKNVSMGDTFTISITLDTSNQPIDGVDVYVLTFNPSVLQVLDSDSSTNGIQIQAGSLMPNTYSNIVDNSMGNIFSFVISPKQRMVLVFKEKIELATNMFEFIFTRYFCTNHYC